MIAHALTPQLSELLAPATGLIALAARHVESSRTWCHREHHALPSASLIKLPILAAFWEAVEAGRLDPAARVSVPAGARVALTVNPAEVRPLSQDPADLDAARRVDALQNRIFLDPVLRGHYPEALLEDLQHVTDFSFVRDGDLAAIGVGTDVLGVNYYSPTLVAAATPELRAQVESGFVNDPQSASGPMPYPGTDLAFALPQDGPYTAMGWRVEPDAFTELLLWVHHEYPGVELMVTENGAAYDDKLASDGRVRDADRIAYLDAHLRAVHAAIEGGADVRGYFLWSLMDNFEWAWGYSKRFGIVHVDFATQVRTPKDSAHWYRDVIARNAVD